MTTAPLGWGRRYLMCPPTHFGVLYEINPWMHREVAVDADRALAQWEALVATLREAGATVEVMDPHPDVPDLVFTANAGLVDVAGTPDGDGDGDARGVGGGGTKHGGDGASGTHAVDRLDAGDAAGASSHETGGGSGASSREVGAAAGVFVPSHFRHPERRAETPIDAAWFAGRGWRVERLPGDLCHEGAGDALPFVPEGGAPVLLSGYSFRSDARAATELSRLLRCPVRPLQLVDPRLYHLDLTFCPLDGRRALVAPLGWDAYGRKVVEALVPEPLVLDDDEALSFCANSVVVDRTVVMPATPPRVGRRLEAWGFTVVECAVDEFLKAGGGCRCLTLALDVPLSGTQPSTTRSRAQA